MPEAPSIHPWSSAVGVLSVDSVLAHEHDRIHGDDVTARIERDVTLQFELDAVIDQRGFAQRLMRGWKHLDAPGARASQVTGPQVILDLDEPSDAVTLFVLDGLVEPQRTVVFSALTDCNEALGLPEDEPSRLERARTREVVATTMLVRLNELLEQPLGREPAFLPYVSSVDALGAKSVDALGSPDEHTVMLANRLLLEAAFAGQLRRIRDQRLDKVYEAVRQQDTAALCLSGGGIRSATFALGLLQGLARNRLLGKLDYISTVSGGGYAGSWLSAWMHHAGPKAVHESLRRASREKLEPEPAPVRHLRAYSKFLSPRAGLFSVDIWTLVGTVSRNLVLNWLVLVPLMAGALLVPRFLVAALQIEWHELPQRYHPWTAAGFVFALTVGLELSLIAVAYVHRNRPDDDETTLNATHAGPQREFVRRCFLLLVVSALLLTTSGYLWWDWSCGRPAFLDLTRQTWGCGSSAGQAASPGSVFASIAQHPGIAWIFLVAGALVHVGGWLLSGRRHRSWSEWFWVGASGAAGGAAGLWLTMWFLTRPDSSGREVMFAAFAPPAFLAMMLVSAQLFTGWMSRRMSDSSREWIARFNAWLLIAIVAWAGACAVVLYGPDLLGAARQKVVILTVIGASVAAALLLARGSSAGPSEGAKRSGLSNAVARAARALIGPGVAVFILTALASTNERLIEDTCDLPVVNWYLQCAAREPHPGDLSKSPPFKVLARRRADQLLQLSDSVHTTGADTSMAAVFRNGRDSLTKMSPTVPETALENALKLTVDSVTLLLGSSIRHADSTLRLRSDSLKLAMQATDLDIIHSTGNDSLMTALLAVRDSSEARAGATLRARLAGRDSAADRADRFLRAMQDTVNGVAIGSGRRLAGSQRLLDSLQRLLMLRLDSSVSVFRQVREDSLARDTSWRMVDSALKQLNGRVEGNHPYGAAVVIAMLMVFWGFGALMGTRIDTNKFSLQAMYGARIIRAYLAASRPPFERKPNPFTGFDPADDLPIGSLFPASAPYTPPARGQPAAGRQPTEPPMHVLNVTLNLVESRNLAWQQRKAASMTISPLYAGSAFLGYRPTTAAPEPRVADPAKPRTGDPRSAPDLYGGNGGITLGTAVTISGAAASPNAGSFSSPLLTFLMTFFNARLGSWLGNPGRAGADTFQLSAPEAHVSPIIKEMFGLTTDQSPYVYLSDGSHFENLALYEMVLRRCRFIVVSDAGADPTCSFADLGNAIRKIRIDTGIPIEFPEGVPIYPRGKTPHHATPARWAVGRIRYSAVDFKKKDPPDDNANAGESEADYDGILLYVKPAIYGNEPRDVLQYAETSEAFPHESTSNQFFGESQFESYRALGEFTINELLDHTFDTGAFKVVAHRKESLLDIWKNKTGVRAGGIPSRRSGDTSL